MNIFTCILDLIFPRHSETHFIETLSAEEFISRTSVCLKQPDTNIVSIFNYKDPIVQKILWELKYRGNKQIARLLAAILYDEILELLSDMKLFYDFSEPYLIPMPSSRQRLRDRGWNQTEMIADELYKIVKDRSFIIRKDILIKKRHTQSQTKLSKSERLKNLNGCFEVIKPDAVKNKNIMLLDDVTTTGSTIKEAAETLKRAGARRIVAFTIAH